MVHRIFGMMSLKKTLMAFRFYIDRKAMSVISLLKS